MYQKQIIKGAILVLTVLMLLLLVAGCLTHPDIIKNTGESIDFKNNAAAFDHTWEEVKAFLTMDDTDQQICTNERGSAYFAEILHNRAEYYGFKAAVVTIDFEDGTRHISNAFNTIDYGLVYVDCTGQGLFSQNPPGDIDLVWVTMEGYRAFPEYVNASLPFLISYDKVVFLSEGKKMGFITLGWSYENFGYEWYEECQQCSVTFKDDLQQLRVMIINHNNVILNAFKSNTIWEYSSSWLDEDGLKLLIDQEGYFAKMQTMVDLWIKFERGYHWEEYHSNVEKIEIYW